MKLFALATVFSGLLFGYFCEKYTVTVEPKLESSLSASKMARMDSQQLLNELRENPIDPNSFARADKARVKHIHLTWNVDFETKIISGSSIFTVERMEFGADRLNLDTVDLTINSVNYLSLNGTTVNKVSIPFVVHISVEDFGSKLEIDISSIDAMEFQVEVVYQNSPNSRALQWLTPEQTDGKRVPFMFSQCQAINARSLLPCQDTPSVKATYTATVKASAEFRVLMSAKVAQEPTVNNEEFTKTHYFKQKVPIPSYLIAIAVGDLVSKRIGSRSSVWSEPGFLQNASFEFSEIERILTTAESLAGPYLFDVYDVLVLPPSFPYGGMENPCLTFATPTLLAGDRSLVYVIAHEISHSWTGNLVTNANFGHFWLNEGFTTFLERKIVGRLDKLGEKRRHFAALEGLLELKETIDHLGNDNSATKLLVDVRGINPDDVFSNVPYEKGHTFLFFLEQQLGGPTVFEPFLKAYIEKFKYQSIITKDFKDFLFEYFKDSKMSVLERIDFDVWFNKAGMPPVIPNYDRSMINDCSKLAQKWNKSLQRDISLFIPNEFTSLSSTQQKMFLVEYFNLLPVKNETDQLIVSKIERMNQLYSLDSIHNTEVRCQFILIGLRSHWKGIIQNAIHFVSTYGRMKYIRPIYREMFAWEETKQTAIDTFKKNKINMMKISADAVSKDLFLTK